ncbi:MAG: DVUA0089 family protein [Rhodobacteraceae bacterium]|nr:DVUA0089 family protein [Paracoccaceae bacterium]
MPALPRLLSAAVAALVAFVPPAAAQLRQVAEPATAAPAAAGACGQPLADTHVLRQPLDRVPAEPFAAALRFHQPAWLEFTLAGPGRVVLRTQHAGSDDPVLLLFDAGGALTNDDDSGGNGNALIDMTLAAGTYCAQVRLFGSGIVPVTEVPLALATGEEAEALAVTTDVPPPDATACADPGLTENAGPVGPGIGELALGGTLAEGGHRDFALQVTDGMTLEFRVTSGAFDTLLDLFDIQGVALASDDDGGGGTDSRIVQTLAAGSYCLRVKSYGGNGGAFDLVISDEAADGPEPAGGFCADPALTSAFPGDIAPGMGAVTAEGMVPTGGHSDWRLVVLSQAVYQIDARSGGFDTMIELQDAAGSYVDGNDDGPDGTDSRVVTELAAGEYCLRVTGYSGGGGAFSLAVTDSVDAPPPPDGVAACSDPGMTEPLGRIVGPGVGVLRVPGALAPGARQDWTMTVEAGVTVQFDAVSGEFDTVLALHGADGARLAENDDHPDAGGTNSRLTEALQPGDYCLTLRSYGDGGSGGYELSLTEQDPATLRRVAIEAGEMIPEADSGVDVESLGVLATELTSQRLSQTRTKWVSFDVNEPGLVQIVASSLVGGFTLRLYDAGGVRLGESESGGLPRTASLYRELTPGRYLVAMTGEPRASGRMNLRQISLARFVRP